MDRVSGCYAKIRHHSSSVGRNILHLSFKTKYCHNIFKIFFSQRGNGLGEQSFSEPTGIIYHI